MKSRNPEPSVRTLIRGHGSHQRGFALVITLSLMILLTVIAVGLIGISSIALRSSAQGDAQQAARANARVALMLAIGDLQKQLGPDTRISATADLIGGATSTVPQARRNWAGAYKSWPAAVPSAPRPEPEFLQWFVSGDPTKSNSKDFATATQSGTAVDIVTKNTVGPDGDPVKVPLITQKLTNGTKNNFAWWVSDLGTKALVAPSKPVPVAKGDSRVDAQSPPSSNLRSAKAGTLKPFQGIVEPDPSLANVVTWQSSALLADKPNNIRGLFHDFASFNRGLLTNVRSGGFRKDLSMELQRPANGSGATTPPDSAATALYKVGGETGINLQELWVYYNAYGEVKPATGQDAFSTGGTLTAKTPCVYVDGSPTASQSDNEFYLKQPVVISYQLVLSLRNASNRLELVADPIITLWNPLDVPVVVPRDMPLTVKYWQIPYDLMISKNGGPAISYPLAACLSNASNSSQEGQKDGDSNFLSLRLGKQGRLAFRPGEVIKFSQTGNTVNKFAGQHQLDGRAGFNYGGGAYMPVRDRNNLTISLAANDTITIFARPNEFTAGATKASGKTMNESGVSHSRHFSLTHHEYYYGEDRANYGDSLGIGNMAIDWDFGNRRLKAFENRGTTSPGMPGTKPPKERMYANDSRFKDIFKTTPPRSLPAAQLTSKQPFMLLSFNAKTERGMLRGTKSLSRFNPKALHVDFYDFSDAERDILPYEYRVESLSSWKNDLLETSASGNAYFGGGHDAFNGSPFVTTHSFPKEPIHSLAAFQHSFANGFDIQKPKYGYATINSREPMLPQISHAIGNSIAPPMMDSGTTEGTLPGGRPMADHSYLANQALWDTWFLSGIAPQNTGSFARSRDQKTVATEFFDGKTKLPVERYIANRRGKTATQLVNTYFSGTVPKQVATQEIASYMQVDGLFNVNSTSVEAWKSLLGARRERPVTTRNPIGVETVQSGESGVPVSSLMTPRELVSNGSGTLDTQQENQWTGRRVLSEEEIEGLAQSIVKEVRKRGPFLSLADFVNRRVGSNKELARSGTIQSALDSNDNNINAAFKSAGRAVAGASSRFTFPEAEEGPISQGIPGIVKQADILTPIAPVLSARSDSFLVRGYGEKTDASGKVIARAWCEAIVQRSPDFIDPADLSEKAYDTISNLNKNFGRRFEIVSFRWLSSSEA